VFLRENLVPKIISVENVCVNYGELCALRNVSFDVERGDFLAIVGQNGSGKSTLIKTIVGLIKPSQGKITLANPNDIIGYLPQKSASHDPRFPANIEEVVFSGFRDRKDKDAKIKLDNVLELLEISDIRTRRIGQLSGGQQQRALLARALISQPQVLVLDEPTGALDPSSRVCFYKTILEMNEKNGTTIIMVSHDFHDIENYVKTIAFIDTEIIFYGKLNDFLSNEQHHYFNHGGKHKTEKR
jgi:zinc transport system ATP-binding protein